MRGSMARESLIPTALSTAATTAASTGATSAGGIGFSEVQAELTTPIATIGDNDLQRRYSFFRIQFR